MNENDNSIFFLTVSLVCVWLIVDYVVGKSYLGKFISMLPFMSGSGENMPTTERALQYSENPESQDISERMELTDKAYNDMYIQSGGRYGSGSDTAKENNDSWGLNANLDADAYDRMYHASGGRQGTCNCAKGG